MAKAKAKAKPKTKTKTKTKTRPKTRVKAKARPKAKAKTKAKATTKAKAKPTTAATKAKKSKASTPSHPFPFVGSGGASYFHSAGLGLWFQTPLEEADVELVVAQLPPVFGAFCWWAGPALVVKTADDAFKLPMSVEEYDALDDAQRDRLARDLQRTCRQLATTTESALRAIHARWPLAFAVKEAADEAMHDTDAWHAWSLRQASVLDALAADASLDLVMMIGQLLGGHFPAPALARLRDRLLAALDAAIARRDPSVRDHLPFYAMLVGELAPAQRTARVREMPAMYRIALAGFGDDVLLDLVRHDGSALVRDVRRGTVDDAASVAADLLRVAERAGHLALENADDAALAARALELGDAALAARDGLAPADDAVADRKLVIYALQRRLDDCVPLLRTERLDDYSSTALGIAIAVAQQENHRELLDHCTRIAATVDDSLVNPITVAGELAALLEAGKTHSAAELARGHAERQGPLTIIRVPDRD